MSNQTTSPRNQTRYRSLDIVNNDPRIATVFEDGDGIWLWLESGSGWTCERYGAHDGHEMTVKAILSVYRGMVPCDCDACTTDCDCSVCVGLVATGNDALHVKRVTPIQPATRRLTLETLRNHCKANGLTVRKREGEYRVTLKTDDRRMAEAIAYYTDDIQDAYDTATAMSREPRTSDND